MIFLNGRLSLKVSQEQFEKGNERVESINRTIKPIKGTMRIHSVFAVLPGHLHTRDTVYVCDDCFMERGFNHESKCLWSYHN